MSESRKTGSVMDKLTRYEFEATVDGGTIPIKSEDGYWFHRYEVMTEIEKLEKQNQMMLDVIKEAVNGYYSCPDDDSMSTNHWRIITQQLEETLQDVEGQQ
jgi:hypothetical protein